MGQLGLLSAIVLTTSTSAVAGEKPEELRFKPEDVAWAKQPGTASISGVSFASVYSLKYKDMWTEGCYDHRVELFPSSRFSDTYLSQYYGDGVAALSGWTAGHKPNILKIAKGIGAFTKSGFPGYCDANSRFRFNNLKPGSYWVVIDFSSVPVGQKQPGAHMMIAATPYLSASIGSGYYSTGTSIVIAKRVTVSENESADLTMNYRGKDIDY